MSTSLVKTHAFKVQLIIHNQTHKTKHIVISMKFTWFIGAFIYRDCFILVRATVDLESVLWLSGIHPGWDRSPSAITISLPIRHREGKSSNSIKPRTLELWQQHYPCKTMHNYVYIQINTGEIGIKLNLLALNFFVGKSTCIPLEQSVFVC